MKFFYIILSFWYLFIGSTVLAADEFNKSLQSTGGAMGFSATQQSSDVADRVGQYMAVAISFLGVIFLCLAIYGGYLWMTAQGDSKKVDEAKDIIKRAVLGLIIIVSAYAITMFVGEFAGSVNTSSVPTN